jgi:hypothetical protein
VLQNFFMIVPRNWSAIEHQRYPQQILDDAAPTATDARFKAAAFLLVACWLITVFSLRHSIKYYCPRNRGLVNRIRGFFRYMPFRFMLLVPLAAAIPAYQALVAWRFEYSPLKVDGLKAAIYAGGYTPSLLILYVQVIIGFFNPNEDLELKRQRRVRGQAIDAEIGLVHKPSWWRRNGGENMDPNENMREQLLRNVREIQGNKATAPTAVAGAGPDADGAAAPVEMTTSPPSSTPPGSSSRAELYTGKSDRRRQERAIEVASGLLFPGAAQESAAATARRRDELMTDGPPPPAYTDNFGTTQTSTSTPVTRSQTGQSAESTNQPPQQIRSMLDV